MDPFADNTTWIVVTDGLQFRLLELKTGMDSLREIDVPQLLQAKPTGNTRPDDGGHRWLYAETHPGDLAHYSPFQQLSAYLEAALNAGHFSRLGVIAPEPVLEGLNEALATPVRNAVILELDADWLSASTHTVRASLPI